MLWPMTTKAHRTNDVNCGLFLFNFFYNICLLISFLERIHAVACLWKSRGKLQESILSFHCVVPGTKFRSPDPVTGTKHLNTMELCLKLIFFRALPSEDPSFTPCIPLSSLRMAHLAGSHCQHALCPWGGRRRYLQLHELLGISLQNRFSSFIVFLFFIYLQNHLLCEHEMVDFYFVYWIIIQYCAIDNVPQMTLALTY